MADARPWSRSIVFAAGCWLTLVACEQDTSVPAARPVPARPTTVDDARALAQALKPRMSQTPGGLRAQEDGRGNIIIRSKGVLQNVMVVGRGPDGAVLTGCVSSPEQVQGLLGGARP